MGIGHTKFQVVFSSHWYPFHGQVYCHCKYNIFVTTFHWIAWQWHNNSVSKHSVTKTMFYHFTIVCHLHLVKECLFVSAYLCLHFGCHVFRHCLRCHLNLKLTWETDSGISTSYICIYIISISCFSQRRFYCFLFCVQMRLEVGESGWLILTSFIFVFKR